MLVYVQAYAREARSHTVTEVRPSKEKEGGGVAGGMARDSRRGLTQNCPATHIPKDGGWSVAERGAASADGGEQNRALGLQLGACKRRAAKR